MTLPVDHLLVAAPDLESGVHWVEQQLGVRVLPGGRHPAWGTHNAIVPLGPASYLEVIAPDPSVPAPNTARPLGLDTLTSPRLATWVVARSDLPSLATAAASHGIDLGEVAERSRARVDGTTLRWVMTDPATDRAGGVIPFFIDWADTPHPGSSGPPECRLTSLTARHPDPESVRAQLDALGLDLVVEHAEAPGLIAIFETTEGTAVLE